MIGQTLPIDTNSMIHTFQSDKKILKALRSAAPPSEEVREKIRAMKPSECCVCEGRVLHGNGWRSRSVLKSWSDWGTIVWYWRIECQCCGKSHCLMPEIVIPDLLYDAEVVAEVVLGRLSGQPAKEFAPHRRTQKRWLDRIREWWPVALSSNAIRGALSDWCSSASKLLEAILRCAAGHVGLFFPSHRERTKSGASPHRKYPAIATHPTYPFISVARL